jgi:hypothetical protein
MGTILFTSVGLAMLYLASIAQAQVPPPKVGPGFDQPRTDPMPGDAFGPSPAYNPKNKTAASGGTAAPEASPEAGPTAPPKLLRHNAM